jgi:CarboxypepD_reg-like domain
MKKITTITVVLFLFTFLSGYAQTNVQSKKVKGIVIDADSKKPLEGAGVSIQNTSINTITNPDGSFEFDAVPVGTIAIGVTMIGYESKLIPEITVTSGKEVELTIAITEKISSLQEVVVSSQRNKIKPVNEFATVSARSINIQDAKRYPAAIDDPARMVQNFAGVSASNDASNEIIVRGNSPQSVLWRLEGVEIPNPNHFAGIAAGGGAVSMLSGTTLGNSDFYSGAFPSEFGNATSGVFDLYYRNGNKDKREYTFNAGIIGIGAGAEGPFVKGGKSSYLVNFRYSTFGLLTQFINTAGQRLNYQDLNFKLNFPTSIGTFGVFGLVGNNTSIRDANRDQANKLDYDIFEYKTTVSVFGITHQTFLSDKTYIKTVVARTGLIDEGNFNALIPDLDFIKRQFSKEQTKDNNIRFSSFINSKLNAKATLRIGGIFSNLDFNFKNTQYRYVPTTSTTDALSVEGNTNFIQGYAQFKYRATEALTLNAGLHTSYLALNKTNSIEPRASISYNFGNNQTLTFATGIHSRLQALSTYYFETVNVGGVRQNVNKNLKMTQALHFVLGYEKGFDNGIRLKAETYYQRLNNIPVEKTIGSGFSTVNSNSVLDLINSNQLVSEGKGTNYGIDINLEKSFNKSYYFITNLSLYNSKYTTFDNREFDTRFNRNYQINFVGGKEWSVSKKKNRILGLNGKLLATGGQRQSEIDVPASQAAGQEVLVPGKFFTKSNEPYYRFDIGISLKTNRTKTTHIVSLDIQNVLNRINKFGAFFNTNTNNLATVNQLGIIPILNYKVQF